MIRFIVPLVAAVALALPARAAVDIQEVTSPGGITAWLVEEHELPFTALEIRFRGGTSLDAEGKRGAINLMTALLEEGAGEMDAQAFAAARESLAARFDFDAYDDAVSVSARFLTENRNEAVALLHEALADPRFDADAVERVRQQALSNIRSDLQDPDALAAQLFDRLAYDGHPYGSDPSGTVESVSGLTRDDLVAAQGRVLAKDRLYVSAVGDITAEELGPLLDMLFEGLPEEGAPMPEEAPFLLGPGITVEEFDTPQSVVRFGQPGIDRDDPDFFPAFVVNQVFGDPGFGSRLTDEVRVKRGLTYGIGTYLVSKDWSDVIIGQVATQNPRVAETIEVIRDEWRKLAEDGVTAAELEAAKTYLTGAYPLRFDGNAPIARILVGMQMEGLPMDYVNTRNDMVRAVTLEDANRVAAELYDPDALHFVVVGRPDGVEPTN